MNLRNQTETHVRALLHRTKGFRLGDFLTEYKSRTGEEFPLTSLAAEQGVVEWTLIEALERLGCGFEKRVVGGDDGDAVEDLFVVKVREKSGGRGAKMKSKIECVEEEVPVALVENPSQLLRPISMLKEISAEDTARDRIKAPVLIRLAEYVPESMTTTFLNSILRGFGFSDLSYAARAENLPSRFRLRATHVEEDGFRFWGRVEPEENWFWSLDARLELFRDEVDSTCDSTCLVFVNERWHRGWLMDSKCPKNIARVFLIDVGLVVVAPSRDLRRLPDNVKTYPPLALPFSLKGSQKQNRGPSFLRDQLLDKSVLAFRSPVNLMESQGSSVTAVEIELPGSIVGVAERDARNSLDVEKTLNHLHGEHSREDGFLDGRFRSFLALQREYIPDQHGCCFQHTIMNNLKILEAMYVEYGSNIPSL